MTWVVDLARQRSVTGPSTPLFGVIVYTNAHVNLKRLLRDDDYWSALDELSGPQWTIFSVRAQEGSWGPGSVQEFGMMQAVWVEPAENRALLSSFELDDTKDLPALVMFLLEGDHLHRTYIRLDESSSDAAFSSLKEVVGSVATALRRLPDSQLRDPRFVFDAIKASVRTHHGWRRLQSSYKILKEIRDWLPL